jgi:carboxypeptidase family protein
MIRGIAKFSLNIGILFVLLCGFGLISPLQAYDVIPVVHGGELFGTIKFKGEPPSNELFRETKTPEFCGSTVQAETFIVNPENNGIKNVVIVIENIERGKKPIISTLVVENRHCHFVPHVQSGMVGETFEIRNSDPVLHNTHLHLEDVTLLNVAMPPNGRNVKKNILQKGIVKINCDAHKFMQGWVLISENPYSAVTDQEGNYAISDIPPGNYKVKVWHEGIPVQEKEITVTSDKKTNLSIELAIE